MPASRKRVAVAVGVLLVLSAVLGCGERSGARELSPPVVSTGQLVDACVGDSLRPAAAAPAQGLWLNERPFSGRVAAMIGPTTPDERALVVTRPVESVEVSADGDTTRYRHDAARVLLELLPPLGSLGADSMPADSVGRSYPAATYAVSASVRLAAYEPCATSHRGPRIRYLRRDASGRIVTDVMLYRASEQ